MMFLQGNLQAVFDALYHLGVITPVLEMDWTEAIKKWPKNDSIYTSVVEVANAYQYDSHLLMEKLDAFDEETLSFLAMEVAREFADYHARETLH